MDVLQSHRCKKKLLVWIVAQRTAFTAPTRCDCIVIGSADTGALGWLCRTTWQPSNAAALVLRLKAGHMTLQGDVRARIVLKEKVRRDLDQVRIPDPSMPHLVGSSTITTCEESRGKISSMRFKPCGVLSRVNSRGGLPK